MLPMHVRSLKSYITIYYSARAGGRGGAETSRSKAEWRVGVEGGGGIKGGELCEYVYVCVGFKDD